MRGRAPPEASGRFQNEYGQQNRPDRATKGEGVGENKKEREEEGGQTDREELRTKGPREEQETHSQNG